MPGPELCHVFMFVQPGAPEKTALESLGLRESYRRDHPGQGTSNICYCFDNAFLELLWVTDPLAVSAPAIARTGLAARANWRQNGATPFGIALRGDRAAPFPTWDYRPPYLPAGTSIAVAQSSSDATQPLLFVSPGNSRPDQWPDGRAGDRQRAAGLREISALELVLVSDQTPSADLRALEDSGILGLKKAAEASEPRLVMTLTTSDGGSARRLELPAMTWQKT